MFAENEILSHYMWQEMLLNSGKWGKLRYFVQLFFFFFNEQNGDAVNESWRNEEIVHDT